VIRAKHISDKGRQPNLFELVNTPRKSLHLDGVGKEGTVRYDVLARDFVGAVT
jgi:hypothetical protein